MSLMHNSHVFNNLTCNYFGLSARAKTARWQGRPDRWSAISLYFRQFKNSE